MSLQSDSQLKSKDGMITPFEQHLIRNTENGKIISKGLSSFGYDISLSGESLQAFNWIRDKIVESKVIDPKKFDKFLLQHLTLMSAKEGEFFLMPPRAYALGISVEKFKMPNNMTGVVIGKSTYARVGILLNVTPLEAGWEGKLVLEISNLTDNFVRVYANEGIGQILFFESSNQCDTSYSDRRGKYQNQTEITYAKV